MYAMSIIEIAGHLLITVFTIIFLLSILSLFIIFIMYLTGSFKKKIYKYDYYLNNKKYLLTIEAYNQKDADNLANTFKTKNNINEIYLHL